MAINTDKERIEYKTSLVSAVTKLHTLPHYSSSSLEQEIVQMPWWTLFKYCQGAMKLKKFRKLRVTLTLKIGDIGKKCFFIIIICNAEKSYLCKAIYTLLHCAIIRYVTLHRSRKQLIGTGPFYENPSFCHFYIKTISSKKYEKFPFSPGRQAAHFEYQ